MGVTPCSLLTVDPSRVNSLMRKKLHTGVIISYHFFVKSISRKFREIDFTKKVLLKYLQ